MVPEKCPMFGGYKSTREHLAIVTSLSLGHYYHHCPVCFRWKHIQEDFLEKWVTWDKPREIEEARSDNDTPTIPKVLNFSIYDHEAT
jgi:hypothetical protein